MLAAEHVNSTAAMGKVYHLLPCHLAWRNAYTFALYTMIATKKQVARVGETRLQCLLDKAYLHRQFLQSA
jgi:hypothetical protein